MYFHIDSQAEWVPNMATSHKISGLTREVGKRAVHLRIVPRTESLSQSREVLELLRSYGRIEMYKSLKYDALPAPRTMLAIFESEESTVKLLRDSPLRFTMYENQHEDEVADDGHPPESYQDPGQTSTAYSDDRNALAESEALQSLQAASRSRSSSISSARRASSGSSTTSPAPRDFQIQVNLAYTHHRDTINANPYNGPFVVDRKSAIQEDLAKRVPLIGLSDLNLKRLQKPWRVLAREVMYEKKDRKTLRQIWHEDKSSATSS